jgi:hypothetical protein
MKQFFGIADQSSFVRVPSPQAGGSAFADTATKITCNVMQTISQMKFMVLLSKERGMDTASQK